MANYRIKGFPNFDWQMEKAWFLYFGKVGGERLRDKVLYGMALAVHLGSNVDTLSWRSGAETVKGHHQCHRKTRDLFWKQNLGY